MEVTAIVSRKGGVGKTTTAQALGAGLIGKGYKVLYIDLDSQMNLTFALGASSLDAGILDVLKEKIDVYKCIQHTVNGDVLTASEDLAAADTSITGQDKEYRLRDMLKGLQYDYIIIDTPSQLGILTVNALTAADSVIIPVQADMFSLQGVGLLNKTIQSVKRYCNPDLYIRGILITRYMDRLIISRDMRGNLEEVAEQLHTKLYATTIRESVTVKEAQASQTDIYSYSPRSNAAKDYERFVEEFMEKEG